MACARTKARHSARHRRLFSVGEQFFFLFVRVFVCVLSFLVYSYILQIVSLYTSIIFPETEGQLRVCG